MHENYVSKTFNENIMALKDIQKQLETIKDVTLNSMNLTTVSNKNSKPKELIESTLCIKVKKKNIDKVKFGLNVNIGCDILQDYLHDKKLLNISLNFHLKNLSHEQNMLYFIHNLDSKSLLASFSTQKSELNKINLDENISLLEQQIKNNCKLSFFIPIFESYDNYDEFYDAIYNVTLDINYLENA